MSCDPEREDQEAAGCRTEWSPPLAPTSSCRKLHVDRAWDLSAYLLDRVGSELRSYTGGTRVSMPSCGGDHE